MLEFIFVNGLYDIRNTITLSIPFSYKLYKYKL